MKSEIEYFESFNNKIDCECGNDTFKVYGRNRSSGNKLVCTKCEKIIVKGRVVKS